MFGGTVEFALHNSTLPDVVEPKIYRQLWPDLRTISDEALHAHFARFGASEGRRANRLANRQDFLALIPTSAATLEIGPFCNPLLSGPNVRFFDVLPQDELLARAKSLGVLTPNVPKIDFMSRTGDLSIVDQVFDCVVSSHCLEHQIDLIEHLVQVEKILASKGRYFMMVPDKRYCFDAFIAESSVAQVIEAHLEKKNAHSLHSVIEHRALTTHNDSIRHWGADHGSPQDPNKSARISAAIREYQVANGSYIDVHAWYFTPTSASLLLAMLKELGYFNFRLERMYPTRQFSNEFWMVLRKD